MTAASQPPRGRGALPADPRRYDAPRNVRAREKGLEAPYIAGGDDPELTETLRRERRLVRVLEAMAVTIDGFVLGILDVLISAAAR
jgi:hypothetical protein